MRTKAGVNIDKVLKPKKKVGFGMAAVKTEGKPIMYDADYDPVSNLSVNDIQIGGDHYKDKGIQPWDAILMWGMGFLDGNALKYLVRFRQKGGVEDLKKARHYIDKLIEVMEK